MSDSRARPGPGVRSARPARGLFVFTAPQQIVVPLGSLGGVSGFAAGVNDAGQVVGGSERAGIRAVSITPETDAAGELVYNRDDDSDGVNDLMVQSPSLVSGGEAEAAAINDLEQILGTARDNRGQLHAVRWDVDNTGAITVTDLGAVNEMGSAAGFVAPSGGEEPALFVPVSANP